MLKSFLEKVEINSANGLYHIYQYDDGNALPKLEIYKVTNGTETPVNNMYGELIRLNNEFLFNIEYEPTDRIRLNTREFGKKFINRFKKNKR